MQNSLIVLKMVFYRCQVGSIDVLSNYEVVKMLKWQAWIYKFICSRNWIFILTLMFTATVNAETAGAFYSINIDTDELVMINPASGQVSIVGSLGFDATNPDLVFLDSKLFMVNTSFSKQRADLFEINLRSGKAKILGQLFSGNVVATHAEGLAVQDSTLVVAFTTHYRDYDSLAFGKLSLTGQILDRVDTNIDMDGLTNNSHDQLIGLDSIPSTNSNNLYSIDQSTTKLIGSHSRNGGTTAINDLTFSENILYGIALSKLVTINPLDASINTEITLNQSGTYYGLAFKKEQTSAQCDVVYAVHDQGMQDSQIFSYDLQVGQFQSLGKLQIGLDLEGLDTHPDTQILYASTGQENAQLYTIDANSGFLEYVGNIGFDNVQSLAFHPNGQLWASSDQGLLQIDTNSGQGQLIDATIPNTINGLTWNIDGIQLFATTSTNNNSTLWMYDEIQQWQIACEGLPKKLESLETLPDDSLVYGFHQDSKLGLHALDVETCQILSSGLIETPFNDIEGIAWPTCSNVNNLDILKTYLETVDGVESVEIQQSGSIRIVMNGSIYQGQLADTVTSGNISLTGALEATPIADQNADGIGDFQITYPDGTQQILYYNFVNQDSAQDSNEQSGNEDNTGTQQEESSTATPAVGEQSDPVNKDNTESSQDESKDEQEPSQVIEHNSPDITCRNVDITDIQNLYSGDNPIQTNIMPNANLEAIIQGKVIDADNQPLTNVSISIKAHDEYGQTITTCNGSFNMAVDINKSLTINYQKTGYLPIQRKVEIAQQDTQVESVIMHKLDSAVTKIDLTANTSIQVAKSTVVSDIDGNRQTRVFFPQGTTASMTLPDGTTQVLTQLDVRATEYTVGDDKQKSLPAPLPADGEFEGIDTYTVELSVDQAIIVGATQVNFNQPVMLYVDNFFEFPEGIEIPMIWYNYEQSNWVESDDGRIIKIIGIENGFAVLDVDGNGQAATQVQLSELGITDAERQQLAIEYSVGKSLWRIPVTHFTPFAMGQTVFTLVIRGILASSNIASIPMNILKEALRYAFKELLNNAKKVLGKNVSSTMSDFKKSFKNAKKTLKQMEEMYAIFEEAVDAISFAGIVFIAQDDFKHYKETVESDWGSIWDVHKYSTFEHVKWECYGYYPQKAVDNYFKEIQAKKFNENLGRLAGKLSGVKAPGSLSKFWKGVFNDLKKRLVKDVKTSKLEEELFATKKS
ncbi:MAG: hypothetical protein VSS52_005195, partial [Thiotrichaceae bacterium]|nr:hypothetical protein [Thiotrichaceae bacterium]